MRKAQLFELLNSLENKELNQLQKWVNSPFFNKRQDVINLLKIYKTSRKKRKAIPNKAQLFAQLFPHQVYDDHKVRLVMSFLNRQVEQFLIYQHQQSRKIDQQLILADIFHQRKLDKHLKKTVKDLGRKLKENTQKNEDYYEWTIKYHFYKDRSMEKANRLVARDFAERAYHLDIYYFIKKLECATNANLHGLVFEKDYQIEFIDMILQAIKQQKNVKNIPILNTYIAAYQAILHYNDGAYFFPFKKLVFAHLDIFNDFEKEYFLGMLEVAALNQLNEEKEQFIKEVQLVYEKANEYDALDFSNPYRFINVINLAFQSQKYDWVKAFIEQQTPAFPERQNSPFICWAKAEYAFIQKDYPQVFQQLLHVKFDDVFFNTITKFTLMKTYYETEEWETLDYLITATETYLRRNPQIGYLRERCIKMLLFLRKITRLNPHDKNEKYRLREKLCAGDRVAQKTWLLEKIDEL